MLDAKVAETCNATWPPSARRSAAFSVMAATCLNRLPPGGRLERPCSTSVAFLPAD